LFSTLFHAAQQLNYSNNIEKKNSEVSKLNVLLITEERYKQGGSNMTGTDLYVNKPHCAAAVRP